MDKWKVAAYLRLSSEDGDKIESNSITNQKNLVNLYIKKNKDLKMIDYYIDDGYSGTDFERPDFKRLIKDIKNEKINAIIVKDLSRFGRNYIEVGNYFEQFFPLYNIRFISINDNIDSFKNPESINNIIVPFKNLMNDEYARDISNKVRSVLSTKRENGEFVGVAAPYGYLKDPKNKHKFIIDKKASKVVKKIFIMALESKSKREIVDYLNTNEILTPAEYKRSEEIVNFKEKAYSDIWTNKKVDNILNNKTYTGVLIQGKRKRISHKIHNLVAINKDNWIEIANHHEPIISIEDYNKVQDIIYDREYRTRKNKEYDIFAGHLRCPDCNNTFTLKKTNKYEYYYCSSYIRDNKCTKHAVNKTKLKEIILKAVNSQIELVRKIDSNLEKIAINTEVNYDKEILDNRLNSINEKISKYENFKNLLINDFYDKCISKDEYEEYNNEYNITIKKLKDDSEKIKKRLEICSKNTNVDKTWIEKFKQNKKLETLNKKIIDELIDYIYIYENGNITIKFKYEDQYIETIDFIKRHKCDIIMTI